MNGRVKLEDGDHFITLPEEMGGWKSYVTFEQRACLAPKARPEVSVMFHAVFHCGLSCVYHRPFGRFSFIRFAQSYLVSLIEGCGVQWKGQTPRVFLTLRTLLTSLRITFGIPGWSRLAATTKSLWRKVAWRESLFLVILLLIYCDKAGTHDSASRLTWRHCVWCQSGTEPCVLLPSTEDFEEMVPNTP